MKTKDRVLKNTLTSVFGGLLLIASLTMFVFNTFNYKDVDFSWMEMCGTALLGWVFLTAKDTLLEGVFLNMFKVKS